MRHRRTLLTAVAAASAGALAAGRAERTWAGNDDPTDGRPLELPEGTERTATSADGGTIAITDMGDPTRPPVVLAHGWTGDRRVWAAVARRLVAAGEHVVVYDQRGHGASRAGDGGLTVAALADDVAAVLACVDGRDAVLAGHSMGGMAVQAFAVDHKATLVDRVASLVLVGTAARSPLVGDAGSRAERVAVAAAASPAAGRLFAHPRLGPWLVRSSFGARPAASALRATRETLVATAPATRAGFLADMARLDLTAGIPAIAVPTTVVWGSRDLLTLPARNREVAALIPGAQRVELLGCGHQLPFEAPDQLADVLIDAVRR